MRMAAVGARAAARRVVAAVLNIIVGLYIKEKEDMCMEGSLVSLCIYIRALDVIICHAQAMMISLNFFFSFVLSR